MTGDMAGSGADGAELWEGAPPRVVPRPGASGDVPVKSGAQRVLGMKLTGHGDGFYFLAATGPFSRRYARRFPLTDHGWLRGWSQFAEEDPAAAEEYLARLRHPHAASLAADGPDTAQDPATRDALCMFGGGVMVLAAFFAGFWALVHAVWPLFVVAVTGFFVAAGVAVFGIAAAAARLAQVER
ncbi:MAG TPA: hypothetical protein VFJ12_15565 [Segeticoccus sp.]|nr:hypothetical protein [Segeticoccus sp.]